MIKPTTLFLGEKANRLLKEMSAENGLASKYFFTKVLTREARAEASMLSGDKLKERLALIDEVEDELVDIINNPPKEQLFDVDVSTKPKSIYTKIWTAHKRLTQRGWDEEQIHNYCLDRYGMDIKITECPEKNPKKNPDWVGGGVKAQKIKNARKIEVQ